MSSRSKGTGAKATLDLIEEAVHLLRLAPLTTYICYLGGTLPFLLGFLYFWAEMSSSAFAELRSPVRAMQLALLFLWMRTWQVVFMSLLRNQLAGGTPEGWTFRRWCRAFAQQSALQPSALFVLPIALIITLPFGWAFAFYQNVTYFGDGRSAELKPVMRRATIQAKLWPGQNHAALLTITLFGFFILLNIFTGIATIPGLIKTFLGIETVFTMSGGAAIFNSTMLLSAVATVYLCVDPLFKAFYVLRCFYGESLETGEDLRAELNLSRSKLKAAAIALFLIFTCLSPVVSAAEPTDQKPQVVTTADLNDAIERTINKNEYAWRLPREAVEKKAEEGWLARTLKGFRETIGDWFKSMRDVVRSIFDWFDKFFNRQKKTNNTESESSGTGWMTSLQWLLFTLIAIFSAVIGVLCYRMWKQRRKPPEPVVATAAPAIPDLESDNVMANQLPENEWIKLARELMERGEFRLALRALYLAGLAHLSERQLISIAKFKSNRDYEGELKRRARSMPEVQTAFAHNVYAFDRCWYGMHEVTTEALQEFQNNLERIRAC